MTTARISEPHGVRRRGLRHTSRAPSCFWAYYQRQRASPVVLAALYACSRTTRGNGFMLLSPHGLTPVNQYFRDGSLDFEN